MIDTALSLLDGPMSGGGLSFTGGGASPSRASSDGNWLTMNNPFSVAGQGGRASATAADGNSNHMIVLALIAAAVLILVTK